MSFVNSIESFGEGLRFNIPREEAKKRRGSVITRGQLSIFNDPKLMGILLHLTLSASRICTLAGEAAAVPFLNLLAAPLYLYHATRLAYQRLKLMLSAFKVSRIAEGFFFGGQALGRIGSALVVGGKTTAAALQISKVSISTAVGSVFSLILPIVATVFSAIKGATNAWSFWKNAKALKKINETRADGRLESIVHLLDYLRGPQTKVEGLGEPNPAHEIDGHYFKATHATSSERFESVRQEVSQLLEQESPGKEVLNLVGDCSVLVDKVQEHFGDILAGKLNVVRAVHLFEEALQFEMREDLRQEIENARGALLPYLLTAVDVARSELHRALTYNAIYMLAAVLVLAAGGLYLAGGHYKKIALILWLSSSVTQIGLITFDRAVDQKRFLKLEKIIHTL